mgnify:CR=1 FL=1
MPVTIERPQVGSGEVRLISPIGKLRLTLEPPTLAMGPHGQMREIPQTRKQIRMLDGRATIPAEWLPLLVERGEFTGIGTKRIVFLEGDPDAAFTIQHGPEVVSGAISTSTGIRQAPPLTGWNEMAVKDIVAAIKAGRVANLDAAVLYELSSGRARETVVETLYRARVKAKGGREGQEAGEGAEAAADGSEEGTDAVEDLTARFARIPGDEGTVL